MGLAAEGKGLQCCHERLKAASASSSYLNHRHRPALVYFGRAPAMRGRLDSTRYVAAGGGQAGLNARQSAAASFHTDKLQCLRYSVARLAESLPPGHSPRNGLVAHDTVTHAAGRGLRFGFTFIPWAWDSGTVAVVSGVGPAAAGSASVAKAIVGAIR